MQSMKDVPELSFASIPAGRYPAIITATSQWTSKEKEDGTGGRPGIKLTLEVREGDYTGRKLFDQFLTDPNFFGKVKLRGLGIDVDGEDIPDEQLCNDLLGREVFVDVLTEVAKTYVGGKLETKYTLDDQGRQVAEKKNTVKGYSLMDVGGNGPTQQAPVQQQAAPVQQVQQQAPAAQQVAAQTVKAATNGAPPPWQAKPAGAAATGPQSPKPAGTNKVAPKPQATK
jgi:hypothetical protein